MSSIGPRRHDSLRPASPGRAVDGPVQTVTQDQSERPARDAVRRPAPRTDNSPAAGLALPVRPEPIHPTHHQTQALTDLTPSPADTNRPRHPPPRYL